VVGGYNTNGEASDLEIVGNLAYIADGPGGVQIIDVSNPRAPVRVGGYDTPGYAQDIDVVGNKAYVADGNGGLVVLRLPDWHGDDPAHATPLTPPVSAPGVIDASEDVDYFAVPLTAGASYVFEIAPGTLPDSTLLLIAPDGSTVIATDDDGGPARIPWTAPASDTYYLKVAAPPLAVGSYTLSIFATIIVNGTPSYNKFSVGVDWSGTLLQVENSLSFISPGPKSFWPLALVTRLEINGGDGADSLYIYNALPFPVLFKDADARDSLSVTNTGTYVFNLSQQLSQLTVGSPSAYGLPGPTAVISTGGDKVLVLRTLIFYGLNGKLDLTDNALIVQATAATRGKVLADVSRWIKTARGSAEPHWQGPFGITSSAAAANPFTGLAVILNDKGDGTPLLPDLKGQVLTANDIIVKYTWNGDVNLDGAVNLNDYFQIDSAYLAQGPGVTVGYAQGDVNLDGAINLNDYFLIDSAYLAQTSPLASSLFAVSPIRPLAASPSRRFAVSSKVRKHPHKKPKITRTFSSLKRIR
jgi:hypothetical protein